MSGPVLLTLAVAAVVFWPALGRFGLSHSEGHRAIPGWAMLEDGFSLLPRLFEHLYLRKPPGMPWAVAASSSLLGATEFAARSVSALAMTAAALASCVVACRWFGRQAGAVAGVALCLMPLVLPPGRSAEIEALNNFFTLVATLGALRLALAPLPEPRGSVVTAATVLAASAMMLVKGPAGLPCIVTALIAGGVASRRMGQIIRSPHAWVVLVVPAMIFGAFLLAARHALDASGEVAVTERPGLFLWNPAKLGAIAMLPLAAWASALPQALALPLSVMSPPLAGPLRTRAKAVRLACLLSLAAYAAVGVSNPRYAMPALMLMPLCCGVLAAQWSLAPTVCVRVRRRVGGFTWWALVVMLSVAWGHAAWIEYRRGWRTSGRDPGVALAAHLPDGAVVHAFELIDARPEVAWYAQRAAAAEGRRVRVVWDPYPAVFGRADPPSLPPPGHFLLLRTDEAPRDQFPPELPEYRRAGLLERVWPPLAAGRVHNIEFVLCRVR